ncbi:phosphatase and actin regulator 2 [Trichonephila clavipes]|uniref:Phosphatase and actin regulator 2 n=1 Tax=Trichonephila clavipes TaxID=2585209 RepID=A0A8X6WHW4_TRICX|nr:phosphatase and actin regulator 2 [Trichonephila clavipes]
MYKNALKEDFIRVVEELNGTVENTDTIVKLKTKIENSSTFESDPDFVKTLIQNCIDERVSRNKREVTSGKQKIELAKLQLAQLEKEVELQRVKNKALSLNPAAKFEEKQFKTLNKETATHIGIREAEDWFRPIDLAKECDIYISSRSGSHKEIPITYGYTQDPFKNKSQNFKTKIKENYPQYHERENKNCFICGDSSHCARDCEKRFKPKESNDHIHNKIIVNTLKIESEKQNSDECANLQYVNIFVENQPVSALIDSGCQIPVLNSSLIRVQTPSEEIITLSSCFGEQRNGAHAYAYSSAISFPNVSVSNVIENSSYDLSYVKNFNTRNDSSSLIKDYKCNKIKSTELKLSIVREKCSDIVLCKKANGAMKKSSVEFISRSPNPSPMERNYRRFVLLRRIFQPWQWKRRKKRNRFEQTSRTLQRKISMRSTKDQLVKKDVLMPVKNNVFPVEPSGCRRDSPLVSMEVPLRTAYGQNGRCGMQPKARQSSRAGAAKTRTKTFELVEEKQKLLDIREKRERESGSTAQGRPWLSQEAFSRPASVLQHLVFKTSRSFSRPSIPLRFNLSFLHVPVRWSLNISPCVQLVVHSDNLAYPFNLLYIDGVNDTLIEEKYYRRLPPLTLIVQCGTPRFCTAAVLFYDDCSITRNRTLQLIIRALCHIFSCNVAVAYPPGTGKPTPGPKDLVTQVVRKSCPVSYASRRHPNKQEGEKGFQGEHRII